MYQLIIRNGRVLDPANGLDKVANVAIENGRIVGVNCFDGAEALQNAGVPAQRERTVTA